MSPLNSQGGESDNYLNSWNEVKSAFTKILKALLRHNLYVFVIVFGQIAKLYGFCFIRVECASADRQTFVTVTRNSFR